MPKLTLVHNDDPGWDWYTIELAEHPHEEGLAPIPGGFAYRHSGRISDADVEGTLAEMHDIALAIQRRGHESFRRCAVSVHGDRALLHSDRPGIVTLAEADELAAEILAVVEAATRP